MELLNKILVNLILIYQDHSFGNGIIKFNSSNETFKL